MNYPMELARVLAPELKDDTYVFSGATSVNSLRAESVLLKISKESAVKVASILDEIEVKYNGKQLYRIVDDIAIYTLPLIKMYKHSLSFSEEAQTQ